MNENEKKSPGCRRDSIRRRVDGRLKRLLGGRCDSPIWAIDGVSNVKVPCRRCLPCRIHVKLGPDLGLEVIRDLYRQHEQRKFLTRRRRSGIVGRNRRRSFKDRRRRS